MSSISNLTSTNASFAFSSTNYTDFNIWIALIVIALAGFAISRILSQQDHVGRVITSVISFISAFAATWGSLSLAHISSSVGAVQTINQSVNTTVQTQYVYPLIQNVSSPWITGFCIVILILTFLNGVDVLFTLLNFGAPEPKRETEIDRWKMGRFK
jgi:membrane-anchored glycerophosphoryl diester phosphodiesterase (GDPDase)